jgi:hypothetical protein
MTPKIGSEITVVVRSEMAPYKHLYADGVIREHVTFTGTVVPTERWQDAKQILNLTTGSKAFPVRSIDLSRVISINGAKTKKIIPQKSRTWLVKGSKGNTYTVTEDNGRRSCTCIGFEFRRQCKHLNLVSI